MRYNYDGSVNDKGGMLLRIHLMMTIFAFLKVSML